MELQAEVMQKIVDLNNSCKEHATKVEGLKREQAKKDHTESEIKKLEAKKKESTTGYTKQKKELVKRIDSFNDATKKVVESQTTLCYANSEANALVAKFFTEDLDTIVNCMDLGFHQVFVLSLI